MGYILKGNIFDVIHGAPSVLLYITDSIQSRHCANRSSEQFVNFQRTITRVVQGVEHELEELKYFLRILDRFGNIDLFDQWVLDNQLIKQSRLRSKHLPLLILDL